MAGGRPGRGPLSPAAPLGLLAQLDDAQAVGAGAHPAVGALGQVKPVGQVLLAVAGAPRGPQPPAVGVAQGQGYGVVVASQGGGASQGVHQGDGVGQELPGLPEHLGPLLGLVPLVPALPAASAVHIAVAAVAVAHLITSSLAWTSGGLSERRRREHGRETAQGDREWGLAPCPLGLGWWLELGLEGLALQVGQDAAGGLHQGGDVLGPDVGHRPQA